MTACAKVAGVLLAAGRGSRFGGNKLEAEFRGEMLGLHAARTLVRLGCGELIAIHDPHNTALAEALAREGFTLIANARPAAGLSHSLALAAEAVRATTAETMLVTLADMPFVTVAHLTALIDAPANGIVASARDAIRMPPARFPGTLLPSLTKLSGDFGARHLLADAPIIAADSQTLIDIDTRDDFDRFS